MKPDSSAVTFGFSVFIALLLHLVIACGLIYWISPPVEKKFKTIPIRLISADTRSTLTSQNPSTTNVTTEKNYLSTTGESVFSRHQQPITTDNTSNAVSSPNPTRPPEFPNIAATSKSQTARSQQTRKGLENMFTQQRDRAANTTQQLSTRSAALLDDYERLLLEQLSSAGLYSQYPAIMAANNTDRLDFEITLILFPSGAIKSATVSPPTAIAEINRLAESTAYGASPYPPPPKKDYEKGFKYTIPISYRKEN